ncbi:hypothetical protein COLSTE_00969 [Collinsella stercoris DSM 13279]|uniref:Uncharacterized protein n=1 Tax=Collinsella stercoris DSM 13279 TaxID=445975 RepID=B6GA73_9ACTN|nr:hypothetical protein COLSTE_00969 [Collinsella stercoris DSM 13279]
MRRKFCVSKFIANVGARGLLRVNYRYQFNDPSGLIERAARCCPEHAARSCPYPLVDVVPRADLDGLGNA